ncbi:MAG: phytanoyl-CoA dioxygenase family protein [Chitinophagales bacterium]|nr:phytanoyl-CoA dioxygenase family protein [Chitinophagales bacterium]
MGIGTLLKEMFIPTKENAIEENKYYQIRQDPFFLDKSLHQHFLKYGWCVVPQVVEQTEIDSFMATFHEISKLDGFELDKHLLNSGRLFNPEIRKKTQQVINENAKTILPRMFEMAKTDEHTGGAYQVKPCHENSDLQIHQDSAVIDEEKDYCLFVWIPFCDVNEENGPIWVLSGSHLWGNTQRSLGVPWNFLKHITTLRKFMHPVTVSKGDVIVFDPALIHCSTPNFSKEIRHAITITVLRKDYELVYYFKNKNIEADKIEKYVVDENFYFSYDFISKPDENIWKKEVLDYKPFDISESELIRLIKKYLPKDKG